MREVLFFYIIKNWGSFPYIVSRMHYGYSASSLHESKGKSISLEMWVQFIHWIVMYFIFTLFMGQFPVSCHSASGGFCVFFYVVLSSCVCPWDVTIRILGDISFRSHCKYYIEQILWSCRSDCCSNSIKLIYTLTYRRATGQFLMYGDVLLLWTDLQIWGHIFNYLSDLLRA